MLAWCFGSTRVSRVVSGVPDIPRSEAWADDFSAGVEAGENHLELFAFSGSDEIAFVEDEQVRALGLLEHEFEDRALRAGGGFAGFPVLLREPFAQEMSRVDHRHERREWGEVGERAAKRILACEERGDPAWLGYAGRLDEDVFVVPGGGEFGDALAELIAAGAADAAVAQLDHVARRRLVGGLAEEGGVDVERGDIVDDDGPAPAFCLFEQVIEQRGFPCAEKTTEHGDGRMGGLRGHGVIGSQRRAAGERGVDWFAD